jgi:hypothetical protein
MNYALKETPLERSPRENSDFVAIFKQRLLSLSIEKETNRFYFW